MKSSSTISYLHHALIDKDKWNRCIDHSSNGLIYGYSFYLDKMAENWDGLILGDYDAVMPLTWRRKFGISYLYQPFLAAQLGVFGNNITKDIIDDFIGYIPGKFKLWEFYLNPQNEPGEGSYKIMLRDNYVLDLNQSYENIRKNYSENINRNIKKAEQSECYFDPNLDSEKVIELAVAQMKHTMKESVSNINRFRGLNQLLEEKKMSRAYGAFSKDGKLLSSCIFFRSHNRAYYILVGNRAEGRMEGSSHFLIDRFIRENANTRLVLDFEGSDIPSLARFYSGFGAMIEKYAAIKRNKLPLPIRWMKR